MRVFFDTNIWISAFLNRGTCHDLIEQCLSRHDVQTSPWVLSEIAKTLRRKYRPLTFSIEYVLAFMRQEIQIVEEVSLSRRHCKDPDDDHILASAKGGRAHCIVTGDKDLLVLKKFSGIPIFNPSQFWKFEEEFKK